MGQAKLPLHDPVCGMQVDAQAPFWSHFGGEQQHFCSVKCKAAFDADPGRYLAHAHPMHPEVRQNLPDATGAAHSTAQSAAVFTCPMHPEIRQDHPGNCPKCGMTLEPVIPQLASEENDELNDFTRRFWWTLPLTVIVTVLAMFGHQFGLFQPGPQTWIELALSLPIVLWAGWPFFVRGVESLIHRSPNMWTLIGLGTGAAFLYSAAATVAPQAFPESFMSMGRIGVYYEAAAVIISLTLLGQMLELKARSQTSAAIRSLLGLAPQDGAADAR